MTALAYSTSRPSGIVKTTKHKAAAQKLLQGSLGCLDLTGYLRNGANTAGFRFAGIISGEVDNSGGSAGDDSAEIVVPEIFEVATSGATQARNGHPVWLTDDNTVQYTPTNVYVGTQYDYISSTKIWVRPHSGVADQMINLGSGVFGLPVEFDGTVLNESADLIPAWLNNGANGAILVEFYAIITEACVGDSEDQFIITLYDGDDNALGTLTPSNAAADAIGDIILGSVGNAVLLSTGGALVKMATAKKVYAKVTQITADAATPAGKAVVFCRIAPY